MSNQSSSPSTNNNNTKSSSSNNVYESPRDKQVRKPIRFSFRLAVSIASMTLVLASILFFSLFLNNISNNLVNQEETRAIDLRISEVSIRLRSIFSRPYTAVANAANQSRWLGEPLDEDDSSPAPNNTAVLRQYFNMIVRSQFAMRLTLGAPLFCRWASKSFAISFPMSSQLTLNQFHKSKMAKYSPDAFLNYSNDNPYDVVQFMYNQSSDLQVPVAEGTPSLVGSVFTWVDGTFWNQSKIVADIRRSPSNETINNNATFLYQHRSAPFFATFQFAGITIETMNYVIAAMRFDRNDPAKPFVSCGTPLRVPNLQTILYNNLIGDARSRSFLVDESDNGHVLGYSHGPTFVVLNESAPVPQYSSTENCLAAGGKKGCFYDIGTYPDFALLRLADRVIPVFEGEHDALDRPIRWGKVSLDDVDYHVGVADVKSDWPLFAFKIYYFVAEGTFSEGPQNKATAIFVSVSVILLIIGWSVSYWLLGYPSKAVEEFATKMNDPWRITEEERKMKEKERRRIARNKLKRQQEKLIKERNDEKKSSSSDDEETNQVNTKKRKPFFLMQEVVVLDAEFKSFRLLIDQLRGFMPLNRHQQQKQKEENSTVDERDNEDKIKTNKKTSIFTEENVPANNGEEKVTNASDKINTTTTSKKKVSFSPSAVTEEKQQEHKEKKNIDDEDEDDRATIIDDEEKNIIRICAEEEEKDGCRELQKNVLNLLQVSSSSSSSSSTTMTASLDREFGNDDDGDDDRNMNDENQKKKKQPKAKRRSHQQQHKPRRKFVAQEDDGDDSPFENMNVDDEVNTNVISAPSARRQEQQQHQQPHRSLGNTRHWSAKPPSTFYHRRFMSPTVKEKMMKNLYCSICLEFPIIKYFAAKMAGLNNKGNAIINKNEDVEFDRVADAVIKSSAAVAKLCSTLETTTGATKIEYFGDTFLCVVHLLSRVRRSRLLVRFLDVLIKFSCPQISELMITKEQNTIMNMNNNNNNNNNISSPQKIAVLVGCCVGNLYHHTTWNEENSLKRNKYNDGKTEEETNFQSYYSSRPSTFYGPSVGGSVQVVAAMRKSPSSYASQIESTSSSSSSRSKGKAELVKRNTEKSSKVKNKKNRASVIAEVEGVFSKQQSDDDVVVTTSSSVEAASATKSQSVSGSGAAAIAEEKKYGTTEQQQQPELDEPDHSSSFFDVDVISTMSTTSAIDENEQLACDQEEEEEDNDHHQQQQHKNSTFCHVAIGMAGGLSVLVQPDYRASIAGKVRLVDEISDTIGLVEILKLTQQKQK